MYKRKKNMLNYYTINFFDQLYICINCFKSKGYFEDVFKEAGVLVM